MQTVFQDLRYALRQIAKSPGFALTAVVSLALGIGATTAVFSVIYAALLNPYPYPNADGIVSMSVQLRNGQSQTVNLNGPQIRQLLQLPAIDRMIAMAYHAMTMTGRDYPENLNTSGLLADAFDSPRLPPALGPGIGPSHAIDGQDPQPVAL